MLSITSVISWGSLFYAISVLIAPIERELGWSRDAIVGAFSLSMVCSGLAAYPVGTLIDRFGGRHVMAAGSVLASLMLLLLSQIDSLAVFYVTWIGLGIAMGAVLYDPAFTVITLSFGADARKGITALTLAGGLASTVFWPLTQELISALGWRQAVMILALLNFAVCAPLHWWGLPRIKAQRHRDVSTATIIAGSQSIRHIVLTRQFMMLAASFTANMLAFSAMSIHLIPLLFERGFAMSDAVWLAALVGPMQVVGRIGEYMVGARFRATQVAMLAFVFLPVALVVLGTAGVNRWLILVFVVLYGASNGIMTIARGIIPAEVFGHDRYGAVNGALAAPVLASRSLGPLVAAVIWSAAGGYNAVIWTLAACAVLSAISFSFAVKH
ncbi:MAG: major facilitator superfamily 1 [Betaproteobacteria bacterium]|nr:major facilitator superfamily 1 [Betaproteobacteria bacterium]